MPRTKIPSKPDQKPDSRLPRYLQIRDDLLFRVGRRTWAPGEPLPSEDKLAVEYEVAVGTLRKALDVLVDEGVIERIRGRGTFIARAFERTSMLRFVRFHGAVKGELPNAEILSMQAMTAPADAAEILQLKPREKMLYLHRTRSFDDEIVLVEHIWLPLKRFGKLESYLKKNTPPLLYPVYEMICGVLVARATDDLSVQPLGKADAALFKLKTGTPAIQIKRLMYDHAGEPVECRTSFIPADRFHYSVEIR